VSGAAQQLRPPLHGPAQRGLAGVPLAHLQQACGKLGARQCIIGIEAERVPVDVGCGVIVAIQHHGACEFDRNVGTAGRGLAQPGENRARLSARIADQVKPGQHQFQLDLTRQQRERLLDGANRLLIPAGRGELAGKLLDRRREGRPPRRGAAQLVDGLGAPSRAAEGCAEQGLEARVVSTADRLFKLRDGLGRAVLGDQRTGQDRDGSAIGPVGLQDLGGQLLGLGRPVRPQRRSSAFEHLNALGLRSALRGLE
jgi:hypothetical protein